MMVRVLVFPLLLVVVVSGAPIAILKQSNSGVYADGSYVQSFETENGISVKEEGRVKEPESYEVVGFYQYTSLEGKPISVVYLANENGFQVQSDAIPTPPPIPPLILKALAYNAAHPEQDEPNKQIKK